jgi:hypothetical protein|tara:strand:- start:1207 stop:2022 length:816 start_codon:yes stop_codon:yes gene_type:complete
LPDFSESIDSRSIQTSGGRGSGTRVFHVSGYTTAGDVFAALGTADGSGNILPRKGDQHPDFPGLIAKDFQLARVKGQTDLWQLTWSYEVISQGFINAPEQPVPDQLPNELGYVEISAEIRAEFFLAWRADPVIPELGNPEPDKNIEGEPVDAAGVPTSLQRNIQELTVTENVNVLNLDGFRQARFKRNSTPFFGSPAGTLLYRGASVRRVGVDVYQVAHSFVEDEFMHLQQQPLIEPPDMTPRLKDGKAETVFFVQPFNNTFNFNFLSNRF